MSKRHRLSYIRSLDRDRFACWWRPDGRGYTNSLAKAGKYTPEEAGSLIREGVDEAWPVDVVDGLAEPIVANEALWRSLPAANASGHHLATGEEWETPCPSRSDRQHCNCWYDGEACCACKAPAANASGQEGGGDE